MHQLKGLSFQFRLFYLHKIDILFLFADIFMVIGAVFIGYASCMLQQGFGPSFLSKGVILLLCSFTSRVVVDASLFPIKGGWEG